MYAAIRRSRFDLSQFDSAKTTLEDEVIPRVRQLPGAVGGYWLGPAEGVGMSILIFETKEDAERPLPNAQPGESPAPGVTVESLQILEVVGKF